MMKRCQTPYKAPVGLLRRFKALRATLRYGCAANRHWADPAEIRDERLAA